MNNYRAKTNLSAFTLIEMLVVMAILGFVGMASFSMTGTAIRTKNTLLDQEEIMFNGIRTWQWLERDMEQLVNREVRNELGEQQFSLMLNNGELSFSKTGWANPLQLNRSELQRIEYRFNPVDDELLRVFWPVMDIDQNTKPVEQVFSGVTEFEIQLLDENKQWKSQWPIEQSALLPGQSAAKVAMPFLVKIALTIEGLGKVTRSFLIPRYPYEKNE